MKKQRHRLVDRGDDCYETPPQAVHALLRVEKIPHRIWEPCCGSGNIVQVLRDAGHQVVATDLVDYGCPNSQARIDFLMEWTAPPGVVGVITNFPNKNATAMVRHALRLVPYVASLHPISFLSAECRDNIIKSLALARVQRAVADDAPPRLERPKVYIAGSVRLVCVESRASRSDDA